MNSTEFITKEIAVWGEDYVYDLLERGYEPKQLIAETGQVKWTWCLTTTPSYATVQYGGTTAFLPFRRFARV